MGALGFGDYLDAGLPVAKSAPNPYTTFRSSQSKSQVQPRQPVAGCGALQLLRQQRVAMQCECHYMRCRDEAHRWRGAVHRTQGTGKVPRRGRRPGASTGFASLEPGRRGCA
jgi:hypothetical protein